MQENHRDVEAARADLCRLLAACYYQPGPEFAEEKVFDAMREAATLIDPELAASARRIGEAFATEGPETLLVDYSRLFLGPGRALASPYGSVWLEGEAAVMQPSTIAVLDLYAEGGFEIADDFRELPDHVAAELEFLYLLLFKAVQADRAGDRQALAAMADLRRRFLSRYLKPWIGPFSAAIKAGAHSGFYRELAGITDRFVAMESAR